MDLNNIQTEKDLLLLKEKVKQIEKKIKENNKPKTITISGNAHNTIKRFCSTLNLNIGDWCEKVLLKEIEDNDCIIRVNEKDTVELNDIEEKERDSKLLKDKYIREAQRTKYLIKSNKIIFSDQLKFNGYSRIDGLPIYEFIGDDMTHFKMTNNFDKYDITFDFLNTDTNFDDVNKNIKTNDSLEDFVILDGKSIEYEVPKYQSSIPNNFFEQPVVKLSGNVFIPDFSKNN
jgi:hypothetical protein